MAAGDVANADLFYIVDVDAAIDERSKSITFEELASLFDGGGGSLEIPIDDGVNPNLVFRGNYADDVFSLELYNGVDPVPVNRFLGLRHSAGAPELWLTHHSIDFYAADFDAYMIFQGTDEYVVLVLGSGPTTTTLRYDSVQAFTRLYVGGNYFYVDSTLRVPSLEIGDGGSDWFVVDVGAADSGGTGYRMLRIPNAA